MLSTFYPDFCEGNEKIWNIYFWLLQYQRDEPNCCWHLGKGKEHKLVQNRMKQTCFMFCGIVLYWLNWYNNLYQLLDLRVIKGSERNLDTMQSIQWYLLPNRPFFLFILMSLVFLLKSLTPQGPWPFGPKMSHPFTKHNNPITHLQCWDKIPTQTVN